MRRLVAHFLLFLALAAAGAVAFIASGLYDISATDQHLRPTYEAMRVTMERSIARRARSIAVPDLDREGLAQRGAALFRAHCVQCHGAPGVAPAPFALALRPLPTPLARSGREREPGHLYWVIREGIKMTGMPAWEFRMPDEDLWAIVAFVKRLPFLTPAQYAAQPLPDAGIPDPQPSGPADAGRGKRALEQYACVACHEIPGVLGPEAALGPPLGGVGSRTMLGGVLPNTPENLARFIREPQGVAPGTAMPDLGVTRRDARDMAAHLGTLR